MVRTFGDLKIQYQREVGFHQLGKLCRRSLIFLAVDKFLYHYGYTVDI